MKKILSIIVSSLLVLIIPITAFADASSIQFVDKKTDATFIVPSGWKLVNPETIGYSADYCFELQEPDEEEDEVVTYMTYSTFEFKSEEKKDIAKQLGLSEKKLKDAVYNKVHYYRFTAWAKTFTNHFDDKQKCVGYVTVNNGYFYRIMFFDSVKNPVYDDFKSLMGSIEIKGTVPAKPKPKKIMTTGKMISLAVMIAVIIGFVIVIIKTKSD